MIEPERILFFARPIAVARLGGGSKAAKILGVERTRLIKWAGYRNSQALPDEIVERIGRMSKIHVTSLTHNQRLYLT